MIYIIIALLFYLVGSIPNALLVGYFFNKTDVRKHGSGNLGATNTMRVLGKKAGVITFILDCLKGLVPILLVNLLISNGIIEHSINPYNVAFMIAIGHCYPIFAGFKGGKAVATTTGILFSINLFLTLIAVFIFYITIKVTRYVSIGSTILVFSSLVLSIIFKESNQEIITIAILTALIAFKHIPNYKKIIIGTENKIKSKKTNKPV